MNAAQLLVEFSERGIGIWPDGDILRLKPKSKLDDRLLKEVRAHKPELLSLLNAEWLSVPLVSPPGCFALAAEAAPPPFLDPF